MDTVGVAVVVGVVMVGVIDIAWLMISSLKAIRLIGLVLII